MTDPQVKYRMEIFCSITTADEINRRLYELGYTVVKNSPFDMEVIYDGVNYRTYEVKYDYKLRSIHLKFISFGAPNKLVLKLEVHRFSGYSVWNAINKLGKYKNIEVYAKGYKEDEYCGTKNIKIYFDVEGIKYSMTKFEERLAGDYELTMEPFNSNFAQACEYATISELYPNTELAIATELNELRSNTSTVNKAIKLIKVAKGIIEMESNTNE